MSNSSGSPEAEHDLVGSPERGLWMATLGLFAGLTTIVFYGVAGPILKQALGLSGLLLGLLEASPHVSKALLRIPFGAWVDRVGGKQPFLILLGITLVGMSGLVVTLFLMYPANFDMSLYPWLLLFGLLSGAGGATFSVGIPQTSYWYPEEQQGWALGVYAGAGNIGPGVFNYLIPVLIGFVGLTGAYFGWLVFMLLVTVLYAIYAVDSYYFQLIEKGFDREGAIELASQLGQTVVPSSSTWQSLADSARTGRTWVLVFLYTVSFGGGFTALAAWFPIYWEGLHHLSLTMGGLYAGIFVVYGSLIRIPGGSWSDRWGGETVAVASFLTMTAGSAILTVSHSVAGSLVGMMILATGMGVANAAVFKLVPVYVPDAVGGASGWIGGLGGAGTLIILPVLGAFTDLYGEAGYAYGFSVFVGLSLVCVGVSWGLGLLEPEGEADGDAVAH